MARTRSLKPSFFTDSELTLFSPLHRLAYQGLWCQADKRGLLEDKPRELKVQILPFDQCDFNAILTDLSRPKSDGSPGFIRRYEINGRRYIQIRKFLSHQKPHIKETAFDIPNPPKEEARVEPGSSPGISGASTDPAPEIPEQALGQSAGFLVSGVGYGSLVSGVGNDDPEPTPGPSDSPPAEKPSVIPLHVERPTKPPGSWDCDDFWQWAQFVRQSNGLLVERRRPNPRKLSSWWSAALMTPGVSVERLMSGFYAFGKSKHWEGTDPPYPFAAFMNQWDDFTRPGATNGAATAG